MDINSKEFEKKYSKLIKYGFCKECIAILTSPLTIGKLCKKCTKLIEEIEAIGPMAYNEKYDYSNQNQNFKK